MVKRGDIVCIERYPDANGIVIRVARDGTWVDVWWGDWSKRMRDPSVLAVKEHVHLWRLPAPNGTPHLKGRCKCGAVRLFVVAWHEGKWRDWIRR